MALHITDMSYTGLALAIVVGIFALVNLRALPLAHSIRLSPSLVRLIRPRLSRPRPSSPSEPEKQPILPTKSALLFASHTASTFVAPLDCDVNIHKSNSTFFTDADVSRARLLTTRFALPLAGLGPKGAPADAILAGTAAQFVRELKPFARYDVVSRLAAWDEAAFFVVTYFVKKGAASQGTADAVVGPVETVRELKAGKALYAVLLTRYVIRSRRARIEPVELFRAAGMLGSQEGDPREVEVEKARMAGLEYVRGFMG